MLNVPIGTAIFVVLILMAVSAAFAVFVSANRRQRREDEEREENYRHTRLNDRFKNHREYAQATAKQEAHKAFTAAQATCTELSARFDELDAMLANTIELLGSVTGRVSAIEERLPKPRAKKKGARR